ncbi:hypothetical protein SODALDRAFT_357664 [Sodiomyces alkalinus F11]|uniref:Uncharacterized protein n=1 Tax=Sodiomyces alkalinus (strain CBS 110278 / VKM F-3762 / F11) TaxID=1314773 RepID=A0A3N2Q488_SODAK|nr:hypothetical protein SODALDRAFT_357664 [Sodiomyces alkalinus F11]ROT41601.1 hypothetical protein SODALDRAFT_357664 [Sodiomyces alkalinus F11]
MVDPGTSGLRPRSVLASMEVELKTRLRTRARDESEVGRKLLRTKYTEYLVLSLAHPHSYTVPLSLRSRSIAEKKLVPAKPSPPLDNYYIISLSSPSGLAKILSSIVAKFPKFGSYSQSPAQSCVSRLSGIQTSRETGSIRFGGHKEHPTDPSRTEKNIAAAQRTTDQFRQDNRLGGPPRLLRNDLASDRLPFSDVAPRIENQRAIALSTSSPYTSSYPRRIRIANRPAPPPPPSFPIFASEPSDFRSSAVSYPTPRHRIFAQSTFPPATLLILTLIGVGAFVAIAAV